MIKGVTGSDWQQNICIQGPVDYLQCFLKDELGGCSLVRKCLFTISLCWRQLWVICVKHRCFLREIKLFFLYSICVYVVIVCLWLIAGIATCGKSLWTFILIIWQHPYDSVKDLNLLTTEKLTRMWKNNRLLKKHMGSRGFDGLLQAFWKNQMDRKELLLIFCLFGLKTISDFSVGS